MNKLIVALMLTMACMASSAQPEGLRPGAEIPGEECGHCSFFEDFPYSQFSLSDDGHKLFFL